MLNYIEMLFQLKTKESEKDEKRKYEKQFDISEDYSAESTRKRQINILRENRLRQRRIYDRAVEKLREYFAGKNIAEEFKNLILLS